VEGISRRELARRHDISESTVRRHVESGALADALLADGSLDSRKAGEALRRVLSTGKVVPRDLAEARVRRLRAQVRKLGDEVAALRASSIRPADAAKLIAVQLGIVARHLRLVPSRAADLARRPAAEVQAALRGIVFDTLEALHKDEGLEHPWWDDPIEPPAIDVDALTPNGLQARKIDLAAEKMEIQRARAHRELLIGDEVLEGFEVTLSTIKSRLNVIPGRVSQAVSVVGPEEAGWIVGEEIEGLLADATPE
jgi:hypothetical protein